MEISICSKTSRVTVLFNFKHINLLGSTHLLVLIYGYFAYAFPLIFQYVIYCEVQLLELNECFSYCIDKCCGSGSAWIRIKLKGRIRIQIRIKVISWTRILIRINLQMASQNVWNVSLFQNFFEVFSLYLEAGIRIRTSER